MSRANPPAEIDNVKLVPSCWVEEDGKSVVVEIELANGKTFGLRIPYDQLDFTVQALLRSALGAYQRQVELGSLPFDRNFVDNPMTVESVRVMRANDGSHLLIQAAGRTVPTEPLGMGSFRIAEPQARDLARLILESTDLMVQSRRRS